MLLMHLNSIPHPAVLDSAGAERLTRLPGGQDRDLASDRQFDLFYATWSQSQFYSSYDESSSSLRLKPRLDDLSQFCDSEYPGCQARADCPKFCGSTSRVKFNNSFRSAEICFLRHVEDLQKHFVDSAAERALKEGLTVVAQTGWVGFMSFE